MIFKIDQKKMAHTYQKLTYANIANYLSDSLLKTRHNHTNMLKLSHSDGNRGKGGVVTAVSNENKVAAMKYKNISYPYFSATDYRRKDSPN